MAVRTPSSLTWNIASYAVMILLAIICIFPVLWTFLTSIKVETDKLEAVIPKKNPKHWMTCIEKGSFRFDWVCTGQYGDLFKPDTGGGTPESNHFSTSNAKGKAATRGWTQRALATPVLIAPTPPVASNETMLQTNA